ncbi:MAG: heme o synthase [bacterium]|nr:heme o synthase [bacterium]
MATFKDYYSLTKPGIIKGNLMTAVGAYFYASRGSLDWTILLGLALGIIFVIASACVFNNYLDRHIDAKMQRTKQRGLVTGKINTSAALTYATVLGMAGLAVLVLLTNVLTAALGLTAHILYVVVYGYVKRRSPLGTQVGTLPGAASITAGYTAVTGQIDGAAIMLFLIMVIWQMPHFYAIAIFRAKEYAAAKIPVLPLKKGEQAAIKRIIAYIAVFLLVIFSMSVLKYTGITFGVVIGLLGSYWLFISLQGIEAIDKNIWAKKVFKTSLLILPVMSGLLAINHWLP